MKAFKIITSGDNLVCTVLVMCCLGYLSWFWFWTAFVLNELSAACWYYRENVK